MLTRTVTLNQGSRVVISNAVQEAQALMRKYNPEGVLLSEELLQERRNELLGQSSVG